MAEARSAARAREGWLVRGAVIAGAMGLALVLARYGQICVDRGNDFRAFRTVGGFFVRGTPLYAPTPGGIYVFYLPTFGPLMAPWWCLTPALAAGVWFALKLAAVAWLLRDAFREGASRGWRTRTTALALALPVVLCVAALNNDFRLGQVNVFVHVLLVQSLLLAQRGRRWLAALAFSVAAVKVTPLLLVAYFALKQQWGLLGRIAAVMAGGFGLVALHYGPRGLLDQLGDWVRISNQLKLGLAGMGDPQNQALQGVVSRIVGHAVGTSPQGDHGARLIAWTLCAALLGATFAVVWRHTERGRLEAEGFCAFLLLMLVTSPDTRLFHLVHLLFPALVGARLWVERPGLRRALSLAAGLVLLTVTLPGWETLGAAGYQRYRVLSVQAVVLLGLLAGNLGLLRARLRPSPPCR